MEAWIERTNWFDPRGMIRSTRSSWSNSSLTSSLVAMSWTASVNPLSALSIPSTIALAKAELVSLASEPPFSITALPDFRHRVDICTSASGRDSNITATTPIGVVTLSRTRPSSSSTLEMVRPIGVVLLHQ